MGCVAKGTLVRMADGSDRLIENLRVGGIYLWIRKGLYAL